MRNAIGMTLQNLGRYDEAEPLHREAIESRRAAMLAGHPYTRQGKLCWCTATTIQLNGWHRERRRHRS